MNRMLLAHGLMLAILMLASCDDDKPRRSLDTGSTSSLTDGLNFRSTTGKGVVEEPDNTFAIPACGDSRKLGYITAPWRTPLPLGATFTVAFNVWVSTGASIVGFEDAGSAGRAALHFQRKSPDKKDPYALSGKLYERGYRQWSTAREALTAGDHVFSAVLTADKWGNRVGFDKAREDPAYAGITLSGRQSAGHGVCMAAGSGYVTIYSLTVN